MGRTWLLSRSWEVHVDSFVMLHSLIYLKPIGKTINGNGVSREYKNDKCNKSFLSDSGLGQHMREQHLEAR